MRNYNKAAFPLESVSERERIGGMQAITKWTAYYGMTKLEYTATKILVGMYSANCVAWDNPEHAVNNAIQAAKLLLDKIDSEEQND